MMHNTLQKIQNFLGKQFQILSILNYRIVFYSALIYALFAVHHFFPVLYSLYTFENFTYLFFLQVILFVIYKRDYFYSIFHAGVLLYKRGYFSRVFRIYLKQISMYFEITNLFLTIILFIGVFLFSIQGADMSDLTGFLIILGIGSLYNSIYKNTSLLFDKERLDIFGVLFLLGINGGVYLFLHSFLVRNGLQSKTFFITFVALLIFNGTVLALFTDAFERLHQEYRDQISLLSRKTIKKLLRVQIVLVSLLGVSLISSGAYFWYGYYKKSERVETIIIPQEVPIHQENNDFPDDFFSPINNAETGITLGSWILINTLPQDQSGVLINTGTNVEWTNEANKLSSTGSETKMVSGKRIGDIYTFNRYLWIGNEGKDVIELQKILKNNGFYKGTISWKFDTTTGNALARFIQAKTGTKNSYSQLGPKALGILNEIEVE